MLSRVLLLKQLYLRRLIGEKYCEDIEYHDVAKSAFCNDISEIKSMINNCSLCDLHKNSSGRSAGFNGNSNGLAFVTLNPVMPFSSSENMIRNIAKNVFNVNSYSLFSLVKCSVNCSIKREYMDACRGYLASQIDFVSPKLIILLGLDIASYVLNTDTSLDNLRGRILKSKNLLSNEKNFIVTYAISDLLKKPSLKSLAFDDFKIASRFLSSMVSV